MIAVLALLALGWAFGVISVPLLAGDRLAPEFVAALAGAIVGGLVSLAATESQVRATRETRLTDYRWNAYLDYVAWHHGTVRNRDEPWNDDRGLAGWDAGLVEERAYIFGSEVIRAAFSTLRGFRNHAHHWDLELEAKHRNADLVNQIAVNMEREMRGERADLTSSTKYINELYEMFPEAWHPD